MIKQVTIDSTAPGVMSIGSGSNLSPLRVADNADKFSSLLSFEDRVWMGDEMVRHGRKTVDGKVVTADDINNSSLFFSRSLEYLMSSAFDVQYEELPFRKLFPVINEGGPGIQKITAEVYDHFGKAKLINQGAADIPFVAAGGKEISYNVGLFGVGASWNMQELHAHTVATKNGRGRRSPQASRQSAAVRAIEEALNSQAIFGTSEIGIPGFLDHPNIPKGTVAPAGGGETSWEGKTADEILSDVNGSASAVWVGSNMIEKPNTCALPPSKYDLITQRRLDGRDISIMQYLIENSNYFTSRDSFIPVNELEGAGIGGTGMMTVYDRNEMKLRMEIPQEIQSLPTQQNLFSYLMLYYCYSAGVMVLYPRSVMHSEGI